MKFQGHVNVLSEKEAKRVITTLRRRALGYAILAALPLQTKSARRLANLYHRAASEAEAELG